MNLLHDKREDEQQSPKPDFHEVTPPPPIDHTGPFEIPTAEPPYPDGPVNKKQSSMKAFFVTLLLLVIVSAAAYFIYFQDAFNLFNKTPEQQTVVYETQEGFVDPDESLTNEMDATESNLPDQTPIVESQQPGTQGIEQQQTQETTSQPVVTNVAEGENAFSLIATAVGNLQQLVSGSNTINTLFFDESTFWAEIKAVDVATAVNLYESINSSFTNILTISSPKPTNAKFLLSGNFSLPITSSTQKVTSDDIRSSLRSLSTQVGVAMQSVQSETNNSGEHVVFAKVSGSLTQCGQYVEKLATLGWDVKISKIIFTPASTRTMSLTLRFIVR